MPATLTTPEQDTCPLCGGQGHSSRGRLTGLALQQSHPKSRLQERAALVARRLRGPMAKDFVAIINRLQDQVNEGALRAALASGNVQKIQDLTGVKALRQLLENDPTLPRSFQRATTVSGESGAGLLSEVLDAADFQFNARDPRVLQYIREQSGVMIKQISESTLEAVRLVVAAGADLGLTTAQQARAIRQIVGLPPNWVRAPLNLAEEIRAGHTGAATSRRLSAVDKAKIRSRIARGTVTESFVDEMQEKYSKSLVNRRAQNIARTETIRAANHGSWLSQTQAVGQGVLPKDSRRIWIITDDSSLSEEHATIPSLNPDGRGMEEPFQTTEGAFMNPPSRTNCRCGVGLSVPGVSGVL